LAKLRKKYTNDKVQFMPKTFLAHLKSSEGNKAWLLVFCYVRHNKEILQSTGVVCGNHKDDFFWETPIHIYRYSKLRSNFMASVSSAAIILYTYLFIKTFF